MRRYPEVLTLAQVAKRYDVAYITAYQWARTGAIPAFQVAERGRWRVFVANLERIERGRLNEG